MPASTELRDWLKRRGRTVKQLAVACDISHQRIYQLLEGGEVPGLVLATKIQELTGIPATQWVESKTEPETTPQPK